MAVEIRRKAQRALDRRALHLFGPGHDGGSYILHWVENGRTMEGLARVVGVDIKRPSFCRAMLWYVMRDYDHHFPQRVAEARKRAQAARDQYEAAIGASEGPPAKDAAPTPRRIPRKPFSAPLTLDDLRIARHTGSTAAGPPTQRLPGGS